MARKLFYLQFAVLVVIDILFLYFGFERSFFATIWWWDILLHVLGGVWVGLCAAWLQVVYGRAVSIGWCVLAGCVVGLGWEVFEYVFHIGGSAFMSYQLDTIKDLADDMIGSVIAGSIAKKYL